MKCAKCIAVVKSEFFICLEGRLCFEGITMHFATFHLGITWPYIQVYFIVHDCILITNGRSLLLILVLFRVQRFHLRIERTRGNLWIDVDNVKIPLLILKTRRHIIRTRSLFHKTVHQRQITITVTSY